MTDAPLPEKSEPFGQWLKARREERGLTLRDVERITGKRLSNAAVSQIETGHVKAVTVKTLHLLSAAYGMDFRDMCERACIADQLPPAPDFCPHCGQVMR